MYYIETPKENSYKVYRIPKGNGKYRVITAPCDELKSFQKRFMSHLLTIPLHDSAHGFVKGRSISTNAYPHVNKKFVLSMDLKDFFPSVKSFMVKKLFEIHNIDPRLEEYVTFKGGLPQGSPCSPVISNIYCYDMDTELSFFAEKNNLSYTRYADDLTFSGENFKKEFLRVIRKIIYRNKLTPHPKKTKVMWRNQRQIVTGVIVNEKLNMPVEKRKKMRALKHQVDCLPKRERMVLSGLNGFNTSIQNGKKYMEVM